jgi:hypothetical protein
MKVAQQIAEGIDEEGKSVVDNDSEEHPQQRPTFWCGKDNAEVFDLFRYETRPPHQDGYAGNTKEAPTFLAGDFSERIVEHRLDRAL